MPSLYRREARIGPVHAHGMIGVPFEKSQSQPFRTLASTAAPGADKVRG